MPQDIDRNEDLGIPPHMQDALKALAKQPAKKKKGAPCSTRKKPSSAARKGVK